MDRAAVRDLQQALALVVGEAAGQADPAPPSIDPVAAAGFRVLGVDLVMADIDADPLQPP